MCIEVIHQPTDQMPWVLIIGTIVKCFPQEFFFYSFETISGYDFLASGSIHLVKLCLVNAHINDRSCCSWKLLFLKQLVASFVAWASYKNDAPNNPPFPF